MQASPAGQAGWAAQLGSSHLGLFGVSGHAFCSAGAPEKPDEEEAGAPMAVTEGRWGSLLAPPATLAHCLPGWLRPWSQERFCAVPLMPRLNSDLSATNPSHDTVSPLELARHYSKCSEPALGIASFYPEQIHGAQGSFSPKKKPIHREFGFRCAAWASEGASLSARWGNSWSAAWNQSYRARKEDLWMSFLPVRWEQFQTQDVVKMRR